MNNPLFPTDPNASEDGYVLPPKNETGFSPELDKETAAELIRQKVARIYAQEPSAKEELAEAEAAPNRSRHQQFMHELRNSGKDLATIQTEWHNYYLGLSDSEKREVWQEFYASNTNAQLAPGSSEQADHLVAHKHDVVTKKRPRASTSRPNDSRTTSDIRSVIRDKITAGGKLQAKHHLQSLLAGLGFGLIAVVIFLFGFFNEVIIAPFIQPSRSASATPIIIDPSSVAPTADPEVIIPKINVQIPVDYSQTSIDENVIENALQSGVVHYPTTTLPGQNGNTAFFGHSSNNIFSPGKYKFAFVLLHELVPGDIFYLTKDSKVYTYKVFSKTIVKPTEVGVLDPVQGHTATATLITCDPPGTSLNRLIIVGDQITPNPNSNTQAAAPTTATSAPTVLFSEGPTLWARWWGTAYGKVVTVIAIILLVASVLRWVRGPKF